MSLFRTTKNRITDQVEALAVRLTGKPALSYLQAQIVSDAFNNAVIDLCTEYGLAQWRFQNAEITLEAVSGTEHVNLPAGTLNVITGTVRIPSEDIVLNPAPIEFIRGLDPECTETGLPLIYSVQATADPDIDKLVLSPIPDSNYTICCTVTQVIEQDDIASIPAVFHGALQDKTTSNALRGLGFLNEAIGFEQSYNRRIAKLKVHQFQSDAPMHIQRAGEFNITRGLQSRLPE